MPCTYPAHPGTSNGGIYASRYATPYVLQAPESCDCHSAPSAAPSHPSLPATGMTTDHAPPLPTTTIRTRPPAWWPLPRNRQRSLTANHGDNPLHRHGAGDDDDRGNDCHQCYLFTATFPSVAALASISISSSTRGGMCPAHVSPLDPLDAADYLRSHCHTPPLTLPLLFAHAQVPAASSPHAAAGTAQQFAHAHAPALASSTQGCSHWRSLHRTGVAGVAAHAQE